MPGLAADLHRRFETVDGHEKDAEEPCIRRRRCGLESDGQVLCNLVTVEQS